MTSRRLSRRRFLGGGLALAGGGALWLAYGEKAAAATFNVQDFGAVGNGQTDDTTAIRNALKALPGTLIFPPGDYRISNDLRPKSGSELQFQSGARLVQYGNAHIFNLTGVNNVKIYGAVMHHTGNVSPGGPSNLYVRGSHHLEFHDVVSERTDGWGFFIQPDSQHGESHNILVDGYTNTNRQYTTSNIDDGLDIIGHDITVRNFDIATNDDAISIKSWGAGGTYNLLIENGVIRSRDGGLTFGSEISGAIRDVTIRNVHYDDVAVPVYFKAYNANATGEVYDVHMQGITASGGAQRFIHFHTVPERANKFHDILIEDCNFTGPVSFDSIYIQRQYGITLRNIAWNAQGNGNEGLYLQDTRDSHFESMSFQNYGGSKPVKLVGSATTGNAFVAFPLGWFQTGSGASLEAQFYSGGGHVPVSEASSIRWP